MADNGSSNTAIVAIVVLVIVAIGLAYFFGIFGDRAGKGSTSNTPKVIEKSTVIEKK